ncbi:hypothetical protein GCM10028796_05300 [Ramlibacter monticola]|uniref:ATP-binding protein n=1 Tax=Ramlibacter monticola TaxID=1926872 RepID=A0A936YXL4_9BURK|nr:hypothetical protein [Ramlibacter monticola]MBL0391193.1 hypothetical protein [Ramlibacter monticola]
MPFPPEMQPKEISFPPLPLTIREIAENDKRRAILAPVAVCTPEIMRLAKAIRDWIATDLPGAAVYGKMRNGKTWGVEYAVAMLPHLLDMPLGIVRWEMDTEHERTPSRREFIQDRLVQAGCYAISHRDIAQLKRRLYDHLEGIAMKAGTHRLLLVMDEAQVLNLTHYLVLKGICIQLVKRKLMPFVLLVGHPELSDVSTGFVETSAVHLLARFFCREHWFRGVAKEDFSTVLPGFDEPDQDDGTCSVQREFPTAWNAGFRVAGLASSYIKAIEAIESKQQVKGGLRLPMEYMRISLAVLLQQCQESGKDPGKLEASDVLEAIHSSGFFKVLMYYTKAEEHESDLDKNWFKHSTPKRKS